MVFLKDCRVLWARGYSELLPLSLPSVAQPSHCGRALEEFSVPAGQQDSRTHNWNRSPGRSFTREGNCRQTFGVSPAPGAGGDSAAPQGFHPCQVQGRCHCCGQGGQGDPAGPGWGHRAARAGSELLLLLLLLLGALQTRGAFAVLRISPGTEHTWVGHT